VFLANHARGGDMAAIARRILAEAPLRFALAGHSMGGYIILEMFRQAPERVARLALLNTSARPETPEAAERRRGLIAEVKAGHYRKVIDGLFEKFVHPSRANDARLKQIVLDMADDVGPDAFVWQLEAIMGRADSRRRSPPSPARRWCSPAIPTTWFLKRRPSRWRMPSRARSS
jgi:pimeloyl-ACP methyl ester carboxylesterase